VHESDDHISDLNTGVVDVVLNIDFPAGEAQQPDESIAQYGIPQMSDVSCFVRIDAGMLNQYFAAEGGAGRRLAGSKSGGRFGAIYEDVNVPGSGSFELLNASNRADSGNDLVGNLAWSLAQFAGKFESNREGIFSKLDLRRLLNDDIGNFELKTAAQEVAYSLGQTAFQFLIQEIPQGIGEN
jgi:hypothetical protein